MKKLLYTFFNLFLIMCIVVSCIKFGNPFTAPQTKDTTMIATAFAIIFECILLLRLMTKQILKKL